MSPIVLSVQLMHKADMEDTMYWQSGAWALHMHAVWGCVSVVYWKVRGSKSVILDTLPGRVQRCRNCSDCNGLGFCSFVWLYISMLRIVHIKIPAAMGAWPWVQVSSDSPEMSTQQCRA